MDKQQILDLINEVEAEVKKEATAKGLSNKFNMGVSTLAMLLRRAVKERAER